MSMEDRLIAAIKGELEDVLEEMKKVDSMAQFGEQIAAADPATAERVCLDMAKAFDMAGSGLMRASGMMLLMAGEIGVEKTNG